MRRSPEAVNVKHSHGLVQFTSSIRDQSGLSILDLGEFCQPNVTFVTKLGHRLYSEDILRTLDSVASEDDPPGGPSQHNRIEEFFQQTFDFSEEFFHGALIWDKLQFLSRPLLLGTVDRLFEVLRPGAYLLAYFQTTEQIQDVPVYSYRIAEEGTLNLVPRGQRRLVQVFNNRAIERLFSRFEAVKFFLTRDNLREVVVKR